MLICKQRSFTSTKKNFHKKKGKIEIHMKISQAHSAFLILTYVIVYNTKFKKGRLDFRFLSHPQLRVIRPI